MLLPSDSSSSRHEESQDASEFDSFSPIVICREKESKHKYLAAVLVTNWFTLYVVVVVVVDIVVVVVIVVVAVVSNSSSSSSSSKINL